MCHVKSNKTKVWFCRYFWIFFYVSEFNSFLTLQISLNFRKLLRKSIFIVCLVNWAYVSRWIEQKVWCCRYFWIFLYVLEHNLFLASQIFNKHRMFFILSILNCLVNWTYVPHDIYSVRCHFSTLDLILCDFGKIYVMENVNSNTETKCI